MKCKPLICGIDVSKNTLEIHYNNEQGKELHSKITNNKEGYKELIKKLGIDRTYIMESTGVYSLGVCLKLKKAKADVRVENPLVIKRYIQMNMGRQKNDKSDAKWIYKYGKEQEPTIWHLSSKKCFYCTQLLKSIQLYKRNISAIKNSIRSHKINPFGYKIVESSLLRSQKKMETEVKKMINDLDSLIDIWCGDLKQRLLTIPALGSRTICYLIIYTDAFTKIQNHRQLIALAGTSPTEHTSGTSISTNKGICKQGYTDLRKTLFLSSWRAVRLNNNIPCKEQYERLKAAGKPSKVALIAVCNKLLRQAFAIATKGETYQPDYRPKLSIK